MTINIIRSSNLGLQPDGTVRGLLLPYGQASSGERFEQGAFARSIRERGGKVGVFDANHKRVGQVTELWEQPDGLYAELQVQGTRSADTLAVSFRPIKERTEGDVLVRTEAALMEISVGVQRNRKPMPYSVAEARLRLLDL